jgi:hypothetical protein
MFTKSFYSCNPQGWSTVLSSSHASAVAPRVSLQARSYHKEDSALGFITPSLKPRVEFSATYTANKPRSGEHRGCRALRNGSQNEPPRTHLPRTRVNRA